MVKNIVVYGKQDCIYCSKAKSYLDDLDLPFQYIDITYWSKELKDGLKSRYNMKSVPIIVIDGKLIGGYTELTQQLHLV